MLTRIDGGFLAQWAELLEDAAENCRVPRDILERLFDDGLGDVLSYPGRFAADRLRYAAYQQITPRYLNDAYVWAGVLSDVGYSGCQAVELGPGRSLVLDLALAIFGFTGRLVKVDITP